MALFTYKATDANNQIIESTIFGNSKEEVASDLAKRNLSPISILPLEEKKRSGSLPAVEKITFCRYVGTMLKSGLSIVESISVLLEESQNALMKKILSDLSFGIEHGQNLSTVFARYPQTFDNFFITLVKAGEVSGTLSQTFEQIEEKVRSEHNLNQKIQGAMMYPAVVMVAMVGIGVLMFFFILPQIGKVFLNLNLPLAAPTKFMFTVTLSLSKFKYFILGGSLAAFVGIVAFFKTYLGKKILMKMIGPIPVIRNLIKQIDMARFCRVFSTLLKSGVPITEALEISIDSLSYFPFRDSGKTIIDSVLKGQPVSTSFKKVKIFPALLTQMIASGEKTGTLDSTLRDLGSFYETEVENSIGKATQILEPLLMLGVGIGVGLMVLTVITPIYSVVSTLQAG